MRRAPSQRQSTSKINRYSYNSSWNYDGLIRLFHFTKNKDLVKVVETVLWCCNIKELSPEVLNIIKELPEKKLEKCSLGLKLLSNTLKTKIDEIELHYNYAPGAEGFQEAKKDFYNKI